MPKGDLGYPPCPEVAQPWVDVLGPDAAVDVFVELGGTRIQLAVNSRSSALMQIVGKDAADRLGHQMGRGNVRVPYPAQWISHVLRRRGLTIAEIARTIKRDVSTVHEHLRRLPVPPKIDPRQMRLF